VRNSLHNVEDLLLIVVAVLGNNLEGAKKLGS
jgi:hypothetical protein